MVAHLSDGVPLYRAGLDDEQRARLKEFFLLTNKPVLAVLNIGEDQIDAADESKCSCGSDVKRVSLEGSGLSLKHLERGPARAGQHRPS